MMEQDDDKITMLLSMGFPDVEAVKKALQASKGDINDAVSYLTDRAGELVFDNYGNTLSSNMEFNPLQVSIFGENEDSDKTQFAYSAHSYLENKVISENYLVPVRKDDALMKCMNSALHLVKEGIWLNDDGCVRFLQSTLHECFHRLFMNTMLRRWGPESQEEIFQLVQLLCNLTVETLKSSGPIPESLLRALSMSFDLENEWNQKNKIRTPSKEITIPIAIGPYTPYGWVVDVLHYFLEEDGLKLIANRIRDSSDLTLPQLFSLWAPIAHISHMIVDENCLKEISDALVLTLNCIESITDAQLKSKEISDGFLLMQSVNKICLSHSKEMDNEGIRVMKLRCILIMRMLKIEHFSSRMVALKELGHLVVSSFKGTKYNLNSDEVQDWMREEKVLALVLQGNLDQVQYTDRMRELLEFLAPKMTEEDLSYIWNICRKSSSQVIDNVHRMLITAASKFNPHQFEHLLSLIQKTWQKVDDRLREKLLTLLGRMGQDSRLGLTAEKMLDTLWDLARVPTLSPHLVVQALEEHQRILKETANRTKLRKTYIVKCLDEMQEKESVYLPLRQLFNLCRNIRLGTTQLKTEKALLAEWNASYGIIKLVTESLAKSHALAVKANFDLPPLETTLVDGKYVHGDYVTSHLEFLQFMLREGDLYLSWPNCLKMWQTLVVNPKASHEDREVCLQWFNQCIKDLETETQQEVFDNCLLDLDPATLTHTAFLCFSTYFYAVNVNERKLIRNSHNFYVDSLEITGLDYVWKVILQCRDQELALDAMKLLYDICYGFLSKRLSKDPISQHKRFVNQCYKKLRETLSDLKGEETGSEASVIDPTEVQCLSPDSKELYMQQVERILNLLEYYITSIEKDYSVQRTILPHAACFLGKPLLFEISAENSEKVLTIQCHTNENIECVRKKIANSLQLKNEAICGVTFTDFVQTMMPSDRDSNGTISFHSNSYNNCLLYQYGIILSTKVTVKLSPFHSTPLKDANEGWMELPDIVASTSDECEVQNSYADSEYNKNYEREKTLPGVVMANIGNEVFSMLYNLGVSGTSSTLEAVCKVLYLLPTDPAVADRLDNICLDSSVVVSSGSPNKRMLSARHALKVTSSLRKKESSNKFLKSILSVTGGHITSFRLLYNLQVFSSKLMPLVSDNQASHGTKFMEDFLHCGGINVLLDILKPSGLPVSTDNRIRQDIYHLVLQMLSYLVCGLENSSPKPLASPVSPFSPKKSAIEPNIPYNTPDVIPPSSTHLAHQIFSKFCTAEWIETLTNIQKIAWASAAGKPELCSQQIPIRRGSRENILSDQGKVFQVNMCMQANVIDPTDATVAVQGLDLLVTLLHLRQQNIEKWYCVPAVKDFVVDVLVGCCNEKVRRKAAEQFWKIAQIRSATNTNPYYFLGQVLIKARLPLWVPTISMRGSTMKLIQQCSQYFQLSAKMLRKLPLSTQASLDISASQMVEDEVNWLVNCSTTRETTRARPESNISAIRAAENTIVAGHFTFILSLLTCDGVDSAKCGQMMIPVVLYEYLFPSAKLVAEQGGMECYEARHNCFPKCTGQESRVAAYNLLVKLAITSKENYQTLTDGLIFLHHQLDLNNIKEFDLDPCIDGSSSNGFVGLKNGGATCYMNAVLQQLYMVPGLQETILELDTEDEREDSFIYQLQSMFAYLRESYLQYYTPEKFWSSFTLANRPVNIKEQQDSFEFYSRMLELLESYIKSNGKGTQFSQRFEGKYSIQSICQDCPHRYEREETFYGLSLTVTKCNDLMDSLDQFVKGDLLEGLNAYLCEKCGIKRTALYRTCIKMAPPVLVIQLKRFGYDWELNRSTKFDDFFKFPWTIDISPYTAAGIAEQDDMGTPSKEKTDTSTTDNSRTPRSRGVKPSPLKFALSGSSFASPRKCAPMKYELVGVVVHSGQANSGHYYSYIKDRRGNSITNPNKNKWFKFNDTSVEEVEMTDSFLEQECFGGTYKAKVSYDNAANPISEDRLRYWNGYLLFYEILPDYALTPKTPRFSRSSKSLRASASSAQKFLTFESCETKKSPKRNTEEDEGSRKAGASLSELSELLEAGEKKGMFKQQMPAKILSQIAHDNLQFLKNRDMFSQHYYSFTYEVCSSALTTKSNSGCINSDMCASAISLALHFLLNTFFRLKHIDYNQMTDWFDLISKLLFRTQKATSWAIQYFSSKEGEPHIIPILLECPNRDIRNYFGDILTKTLETDFGHTRDPKTAESLVRVLLSILDFHSLAIMRQPAQYFGLLRNYVSAGQSQCMQLIELGGLKKLVDFMLSMDESGPRKLTSAQEFTHLHDIIAIILLNCGISDVPRKVLDEDIYFHAFVGKNKEENYPHEIVKELLCGDLRSKWLKKVMFALREGAIDRNLVTEMLVEISKCDASFSCAVLDVLMNYYATAPSHALQSLTQLLSDILCYEEQLLTKERLNAVLCGSEDNPRVPFKGLFQLFEENKINDSRRAYQCIKLIVSLSSKSNSARDIITSQQHKWQFSVSWLKEQMNATNKSTSDINLSNDDLQNTKTFQRTTSAQWTLQEATALLGDIDPTDMDVDEPDLEGIDEYPESVDNPFGPPKD